MPTTTDFYSQCEAGLMTKLRTLTDYFPNDWQVADDDTVIAKGADNFAIVRPGQFPVAALNMHVKDYVWHVVLDLYVRYAEYKTSWSKFKALRSAIINICGDDPSLANTPNVAGVVISSNDRALYFKFDDTAVKAQPNFIIQTLDAAIRQRVQFDVS